MNKLMRGIAEFIHRRRPEHEATFRSVAREQHPTALLIACSDSRIVPGLLFGAGPGDIFEVRTIGNIVPPAGADAIVSTGDHSEAAAVEYAVLALGIRHVVVLGHSNCGAMKAIVTARVPDAAPNLARWLAHAAGARDRLAQTPSIDRALPPEDRLSQANVLQQLDHVRTYRLMAEGLGRGALELHGGWFDVGRADLHEWRPPELRFVRLDPDEPRS